MNIVPDSEIRFGVIAVYLNMFGVIFSGLIFPMLALLVTPQPAWQDPAVFVKHFHPLQTATFYCGYFLVIGSLMTFIFLFTLADGSKKLFALSGLIINSIFTAVVFLNYIIQTTYMPYLATYTPPEYNHILPVFTMANPGSFAWALEMYGWGGIGLSFIFMAFIFGADRISKTLKILFIVNGSASIISALITSVDMNWLFSPAGLAALVIWNILVFVIDIFLLKYFRRF